MKVSFPLSLSMLETATQKADILAASDHSDKDNGNRCKISESLQ